MTRIKGASRGVADLVKLAVAAGWLARRTGDNHVLLTPPVGGKPVAVGLTLSDHRALANIRAELKRGGLNVRRTH